MKLFKKLNNYNGTQLRKFIVIGVLAASVEFGSLVFLVRLLNTNLYIANSLSFLLGLITSFGLNRFWTFKGNKFQITITGQLGLYFLLALVNLFLTNIFLLLFIKFGFGYKISKLIAMSLTSTWNFIFYKQAIFMKSRN